MTDEGQDIIDSWQSIIFEFELKKWLTWMSLELTPLESDCYPKLYFSGVDLADVGTDKTVETLYTFDKDNVKIIEQKIC